MLRSPPKYLMHGHQCLRFVQPVLTLDDSGGPADVFLQLCGRRVRRSRGWHPQRRRRTLLVALPPAWSMCQPQAVRKQPFRIATKVMVPGAAKRAGIVQPGPNLVAALNMRFARHT